MRKALHTVGRGKSRAVLNFARIDSLVMYCRSLTGKSRSLSLVPFLVRYLSLSLTRLMLHDPVSLHCSTWTDLSRSDAEAGVRLVYRLVHLKSDRQSETEIQTDKHTDSNNVTINNKHNKKAYTVSVTSLTFNIIRRQLSCHLKGRMPLLISE